MRTYVIKDGLIPLVTARNLGPNFPLDEVESNTTRVTPPAHLTNGTGVGQAPTSTTSTTEAPVS